MPPLLALNDPIGPAPPSPGMRVERYEIAAGLEYADRHEDQVVALYLKPASLHYAPQPSASSRPLSLGPHLATICRRRQTETICWAGAASLLCVSVSDGALNEAARFLRGSEHIEIRPAPEAHDPALTNLLHAVEAERAQDYPSGQLFLDSVEHALAATLVAGHGDGHRVAAPRTGGLAPFRLRRVLEFMEGNIDGRVDLDGLAAVAELSVSHFAHQFRASVGKSPHQYMLQRRVERAMALLGDPGLSILDVALAVGFETRQHFATVFRRFAGMSPTEFRRQL